PAYHLQRGQQKRGPGGFTLQSGTDLADGAEHPIEVLPVPGAHIHYGVRKLLAQIRKRGHAAVWEHLNGTLSVAQHYRPEIDLLDDARHAVDAADVPDPHLIFQDDEEPRDDVADQVLCTESE